MHVYILPHYLNVQSHLQVGPFNGFLQVLHEVPDLYNALSSESVAALNATNTESEARAKEVILSEPGQLIDLLRTSRPWLATVTLEEQDGGAGRVVFSPAAISGISGSFPSVRHVYLSYSRLGPSAVQLLVKAHMPRLQVLHLSSNSLGAAGVRHLAQGRWPELEELQLSCTDLDVQAVPELLLGSWPVLHMLNLHGNKVDRAAAGHFGAIIDSFPEIKTLDLSGNDQAQSLHQTLPGNKPWPHLTALDLSCCNLEADDIQSLVVASLPQLNFLNLDDNKLCQRAMHQLVTSSWPYLEHLSIVYQDMDASSVALLQHASWSLKRLWLYKGKRNMGYDHEAEVSGIIKANWPDMESLSLAAPGHRTFAKLCKGNWLRLQHLFVSIERCDALLIKSLVQSSWGELKSLDLGTYTISPCALLFFGITFDQFQAVPQMIEDRELMIFSESSDEGPLPQGSAARSLWPHLDTFSLKIRHPHELHIPDTIFYVEDLLFG